MVRALACSFCGRSEAEVDKLVAGPHVFICDRCARETIRIMETTPPAARPPLARRPIWRRLLDWSRPSRPLELNGADVTV